MIHGSTVSANDERFLSFAVLKQRPSSFQPTPAHVSQRYFDSNVRVSATPVGRVDTNWAATLVHEFTIRKDVSLDSHERLQDEVDRWARTRSHSDAGLVARFFAATASRPDASNSPTAQNVPPPTNVGVEILVFQSSGHLAAWQREPWEDGPFHDGHVLRQRQAMYRRTDDTSTTTVYGAVDGLFLQQDIASAAVADLVSVRSDDEL